MRYTSIMIIAAAGILSANADANICYEYPQEDIKLVNIKAKAVGETEVREFRRVEDSSKFRIVVGRSKKLDKLNTHNIYLINRSDNKSITYQMLECTPRKGFTGGFDCHGECDLGSAVIDRNGDLIIDSESITLGESIDADEGEWELSPKKNGTILKATRIPCPAFIEKSRLADDKDIAQSYVENIKKQNSEKARYVCYTSKSISADRKPVYTGCKVSKYPCRSVNMMHFGHYGSALATDEALVRCIKSQPKMR